MFINEDTLRYPVSEREIRALYPNTSFPVPFAPPAPFAAVFESPTPAYDAMTQYVREIAPVKDAADRWVRAYEVVALTEEQIAANAATYHAEQVRAIEAQFEAEIAAIKAGYTADEISSWPYQSAEARAWQADNNAPTPLIDAILLTRGGTKEELVTRILTNSAAYSEAFGQALGRKQAAVQSIATS